MLPAATAAFTTSDTTSDDEGGLMLVQDERPLHCKKIIH